MCQNARSTMTSSAGWRLLMWLFVVSNCRADLSLGMGFSLGRSEPQGPLFFYEPAHHVDFSNSTGTHLDCSAHGSPSPTLRWVTMDGVDVVDVGRVRRVFSNGTLSFPPFRAEDYRQDVHAAVYRCVASNALGTIVSREVRIRAVVKQVYEVQVYDEYVIRGNTAVLKCHIPSFVIDYVVVTSWVRDMAFNIQTPVETGGQYMMMPTGELHVREVTQTDGYKSYRCKTTHRLTGETRLSSTFGRLIVTDPRGSVQPRITDSKQTVNARQGERIALPCAAQGYPIPSYSWFTKTSKGQLIPLSMTENMRQISGTLIITTAHVADSATYVCVVNNSVGSERVETALTVTVPLGAYIKPQKQTIDIGKAANFTCVISGVPIRSVSWFKDGGPLLSTDRIRLMTRDYLQIAAVKREDRGMYQCHVRNDMEYVQATAELRLGDASPEFLSTFQEQTVPPGKAVSLQCVVAGNPPPQIAWTLHDSPLPVEGGFSSGTVVTIKGDVVGSLNISQVRTEDGGEYRCIARNRAGAVEHFNRLNVYGRPYIRPMPKLSIVDGDTMTIKCPVSGYPIESITWEKDGMTLPVNHRQEVHSNGTLMITNVQRLTDSGRYSCVARNPQGLKARRDLEVIVMAPPKIIPFSFQDDELSEGMRAQISCAVRQGDLPITIRWLKDGAPVGMEGSGGAVSSSSISTGGASGSSSASGGGSGVVARIFDEYTSILSIEAVSVRHNGNYTCVASNAAAAVNFTAALRVNVPPVWLQEPQDSEVLVGRRLQVDCTASGFPQPAITWKKAVGNSPGKYQELPYGLNGIEQHANGTLALVQASESDRGYYLCQASNGIGAGLSKVVFINVHIPARFDQKFRNQTVKKGDLTILTCNALGDTPTVIAWSVNRQQISPTDLRYKIKETTRETGLISEMTIARAERGDSATYSCQASNSYGKDESSIQLVVQEAPDAPRNVRVLDQNKRSMQITWTEPYNGNSGVHRYIVQYKKSSETWQVESQNATVSGTQTMFTISNLSPAATYNVRLFAENDVGISRPSDVITMSTTEEAPAGPPQKVKVDAVDSNTLKVTWKPPRKELWNGHIQGYYVGYKVYDSAEPYIFSTVEVHENYPEEIHLHLTSLLKFTRYGIVVQSYNRLGTGPKSDEVVALTLEDVPDKPPEDVKCTTVSAQSLHVGWEPPHQGAVNGVLQGYKVLYIPTTELNDIPVTETKITTALKTTLHGLERNTNYSIQVLAFTRVGDGIKSEPIFCRTNEDVPEAPSDIKAALMSSDSILVVWKPPLHPNGVITKYTVYMRTVEETKEETTKHSGFYQQLYFEATNLKKARRFDFWVTASTNIGEGQSTRVVSQTTGAKIPAKIVSFGDNVVLPWKSNVDLPCKAVGAPAPEREWKARNHLLAPSERIKMEGDGVLSISNLQSNDAGNYSCYINNIYGNDEITYNLLVLAPPAAPTLFLSATSLTSLQVKWKPGFDGGSPIRSYSLNHKRDYGDWEEVPVQPTRDSYTLENLWCGSRYQLYMAATNKIGVGEPSAILTAKTKGHSPEVPPREKLVHENSTYVTLNLDTWTSGGCPILYFVVEYKAASQDDWTLVSNNVKPLQDRFVILDLKAGSWYNLKVTAHNSAGSTTAEYSFVTLTIHGGTIPPMMVSDQDVFPFAFDLRVVLSVVASLLIIFATLVFVCYCIRRQRQQDREEKPGDIKPAPSTKFNVINANDAHPAHEKGSFTLLLSNSNDAVLRSYGSQVLNKNNPAGMQQEDICPYATFRVPGCREQQEHANLAASAQYHTYSPRNSVTEYASRQQQTPLYSKVQKQMIQQHATPLPIERQQEYASPVSDSDFSDPEVAQYTESYAQLQEQQPLPVRLEHRVPDLLYHRPGSTSTESSPERDRQLYQRPGRTRNRNKNAKPNLVAGNRSSSPESPDEEQPHYAFGHHLDPPLHFTDTGHGMVLQTEQEEEPTPQGYLDGGWGNYTADMKCKDYSPVPREDATLLVRRFQAQPSAPLLHHNELTEDYTIAV